jgi:hypothetical protein
MKHKDYLGKLVDEVEKTDEYKQDIHKMLWEEWRVNNKTKEIMLYTTWLEFQIVELRDKVNRIENLTEKLEKEWEQNGIGSATSYSSVVSQLKEILK